MNELATALFNAGCAAMQGQNFELGENLFELALEHDPSSSVARLNLDFCRAMRGALYSGNAIRAIQLLRDEDPMSMNYRALYRAVFAIADNHVIGDVAEFGTDTGRTALVLAAACADVRLRKGHFFTATKTSPPTLHLFDSFQGMPDSSGSSVDQQMPSVQLGIWGPGTCAGLSEEQLRTLLWENVPESREFTQTHKGWFSETMPKIPRARRFALIHIDCDLYSSTCDVLNGLFGRGLVAEGALLFFDDWWCNRGDPELGEQRAWAEAVARYQIRFSDRGDYSASSRSFAVHGYRSAP